MRRHSERTERMGQRRLVEETEKERVSEPGLIAGRALRK